MDEWIFIDDLEQSRSKHYNSESSNASESTSRINNLISDIDNSIVKNEIDHNNVMYTFKKKVEDSYESCSILTVLKVVQYQTLLLYMRLKSLFR